MKKLVVLIGFLGLVGSANSIAPFQTMPREALVDVGTRLSDRGFLTFIKEVPGPDRKEVIWDYFKNSANPTALIKALEVDGAGKLKDKAALVDILSAIKANNVLKVPHKLNLDRLNKNNNTALMQMTKQGHFNSVKILVDAGANLDRLDKDNNTALMQAAKHGHLDSVKILVDAGANLDRQDIDGNTALMLAIENRHKDIAEYLVTAGAKVNHANNKRETAIGLAISKNYKELENKLNTAGADRNFVKQQRIIVVAETGNVAAVRDLISRKADLNIQDNNGNTALIKAAENGHLETVKELIAAKADLNIQDNNGNTALIKAAENGHLESVKE
ncbi:MAG TPA: ankyrin repeat domain-containing protein, partial [Candidatus Babeliales bacterium]|nr:ankyrin repeat domain-containing protein [Candidatus Babeliales bacterium]